MLKTGPAMYVKALVLGFAILAAFLFGRSTGIDAERSKRAETAEKTVEQRNEAEKVIVQERVVYRDRIQKIREVTTNNCELPPDLISLLRESGIFRH